MCVYETGEIWIRPVACTNVIFLIVILYFSCARCYHWRKLGGGYREGSSLFFFATSCYSTIISK